MQLQRRRREIAPTGKGASGRDRWLLSYADFMTLLLALFVVLYASARTEGRRDASLFGRTSGALDELLAELPPIASEVDETLRAEPAGPPPEDIPLP